MDIFTNAHVVGVANNTQKICDAMDLDYETTKHCILAAYMHDVGKIKIPSSTLQKNGPLTDEEYEIMKMHTVYGYEICQRYEQFSYLAPIARYHHENLDGSGYPDGLKDEEIPDVDALYIGGGYPEVFKEDLSNNKSMLERGIEFISTSPSIVSPFKVGLFVRSL